MIGWIFYAKPLDGFKTRVNVTPEEVESGDGWELVREDYTSSADKYNMFVSAMLEVL